MMEERRALISIQNQSRFSVSTTSMTLRKRACFGEYPFRYQCRCLALIFILSLLWKDNRCLAKSDFSINASAEVVAQRGLCVYIPCTFTLPDRYALSANAKGLWYKGSLSPGNLVAYKSVSETSSGRRFFMTGNVSDGDCSFSIDDANKGDESKYLFRIEDGLTKYSYLETQPSVKVTDIKCLARSSYHIIAPTNVTAQMGLCIQISCTFTVPADTSLSANARGLWYKSSIIPLVSLVASKSGNGENTRKRFLLTGDVSKGDCSLSINNVQTSDESQYQFRIEDGSTKFTFVDIQPFVKVTDLTEKPVILPVSSVKTDRQVSLTCITPGRCVGASPNVVWNGIEGLNDVRTLNNKVDYDDGNSTYFSHITFTPTRQRSRSTITCTVAYGNSSSATTTSSSVSVEYVWRNRHIANASAEDVSDYQDTFPSGCSGMNILPIIVCIVAGNVIILILMGLGLFCYVKRIKEDKAGKGNGSSEQKTDVKESTYQDLQFRSQDIYQTINGQI